MAKFMNAELIEIKGNLKCAHCEKIFQGSDSQAWKVKYEKKNAVLFPLLPIKMVLHTSKRISAR